VLPARRAFSGGADITMYGDPIYIGTTVAVKINDKVCNITRYVTRVMWCDILDTALSDKILCFFHQ